MFKNRKVKALQEEVSGLQSRVQSAKNELADVKHQKKIEEEDIKHMVRRLAGCLGLPLQV